MFTTRGTNSFLTATHITKLTTKKNLHIFYIRIRIIKKVAKKFPYFPKMLCILGFFTNDIECERGNIIYKHACKQGKVCDCDQRGNHPDDLCLAVFKLTQPSRGPSWMAF